MDNNTKRTRTRRTQPKKCTHTICGMTCIKTGYTCHDNDPNAKKKIRQRGKELVDRIQGKTTTKTKVDRTVEKSSARTKTKNRSQGRLAYEQLTKDSKTGARRSKSETYNQGLGILAKYGGKEDSRTKVDRAVEKASTKTRRKPQTENEKTAKVLRREEAQRILRELQEGEPKPEKVRANKGIDTPLKTGYKEGIKDKVSPVTTTTIPSESQKLSKVSKLTIDQFLKAQGRQEERKRLKQLDLSIPDLEKRVKSGQTGLTPFLNQAKAERELILKTAEREIRDTEFTPKKKEKVFNPETGKEIRSPSTWVSAQSQLAKLNKKALDAGLIDQDKYEEFSNGLTGAGITKRNERYAGSRMIQYQRMEKEFKKLGLIDYEGSVVPKGKDIDPIDYRYNARGKVRRHKW